eukprot:TRINITY_DN32700_c0_g1_i1.p1 TRINITY_DN32700_c0_g1~~TRINITY_DN32700_c0_g1_i1.p1  ORF type:complete len:107 (-),score=0.91 TRINITY_DN32700_c0_g1_i1:41-361(-)
MRIIFTGFSKFCSQVSKLYMFTGFARHDLLVWLWSDGILSLTSHVCHNLYKIIKTLKSSYSSQYTHRTPICGQLVSDTTSASTVQPDSWPPIGKSGHVTRAWLTMG